jgi:hypothetical protein
MRALREALTGVPQKKPSPFVEQLGAEGATRTRRPGRTEDYTFVCSDEVNCARNDEAISRRYHNQVQL